MKKNLGTVLSVCAVLALVVLCVLWSEDTLDGNQLQTLKILLTVCAVSAAYCFVVGELTRNYSQMDKLWSVLPIVYAWVIAARGDMKVRLVVFAVIVTLWGIRLTYNFARKGAYRLKFWEGNEDYRWSIVKQNPIFRHGVVWTLFDLFFISIYQNVLVLAICLPALAVSGAEKPFGALDFIASGLAVAFLVLEAVADEYQWSFHQKKKQLMKDGAELSSLPSPYDLGFNTLGPWSRMRHPNYLGEQGIWLSLYIFVIGAGTASRGIFDLTFIGPLLLVLLFSGSSALGESISSKKYPEYENYRERVYKYLPFCKYESKAE